MHPGHEEQYGGLATYGLGWTSVHCTVELPLESQQHGGLELILRRYGQWLRGANLHIELGWQDHQDRAQVWLRLDCVFADMVLAEPSIENVSTPTYTMKRFST